MKRRFFLLTLFLFEYLAFAQQPTLDWAKSFGGALAERTSSIAVDHSGNVYVVGGFYGTVDFDPGPGVTSLSTAGNADTDAFISKFDAFGNFVWVKRFGTTASWEESFAVTTDAVGNVYTTGFFSNTVDFDPGAGVYNLTEQGFGSDDMFISKLDSNGNFIFAKQIGGNGSEIPKGIALDNAGNIYTTGEISSAIQGTTILTTDFDPGPGVFPLTSTTGLNGDVFVSKLDNNGNFIWAKNLGGINHDDAKAIAVDGVGNVYITGIFQGTADFDPSANVANLVNGSPGTYYDIFVCKLDTNANYMWAKSFGSTNKDDYGFGIAVDSSGNVYSTGTFQATVDFDPGAGVANLVGGYQGNYISKLDSNGNYVWAKTFFGNGCAGKAITLDNLGNVYTTGYFGGTCDFDPNAGVANLTATGGTSHLFISKLDVNGNYVWAKSFGNAINNNYFTFGNAITVDSSYNVYTTGTFRDTVDFDPCPTILNLTSNGDDDVFVQKLSQTTVSGPTFNTIPPICSGTTAPILPTTSTNGVVGTWNPATVSNTASGTYTFTPDPGQCVTLTTSVTITVNPVVTTTFAAISDFCSGTTPPILPTTSSNGIIGTWNPSVVSNTASGTYTFTPNTGQCGTVFSMTINVLPSLTPTFTQIAPICAGDTLTALPTTSDNGITGTWSPAINNMATTTYTFTPNTGICATTQTMTITVNSVTPTFSQVAPICAGETLTALPTTSNNGITGTWTPALNNTTTTTYTFMPTIGQCASIQTMTIIVNTPIIPTFNQVAPICTGTTLSALPTTSNNGIIGNWSPSINNTATTTYTFTPNAGQCATTQTMTITINTSITPTFTAVASICKGDFLNALPTTSNNSITGTWSPAINNLTTTTYTFTPNSSSCATTQTMTIVVNNPVTPLFNAVAPICLGDTLSPLPTTSTNGISGSWSPTINNLATTTYTFTPSSGFCATTQTMTIAVNSITPTFIPVAPICKDDVMTNLPTTSLEGITGNWSPALNNTATTTYTFTPNPGQCASTQVMTIDVKPFIQLTATINSLEFFNNNDREVTVVVSPPGNYLYTLDGNHTQNSNVFSNVSSCNHTILVQDVSGCGKSDITINFFVWGYPLFFTPNEDGFNEYWNVFCNDAQPALISIYDRYGKLLTQFSSMGNGWNGKYNGQDMPSDDYWFVIEYTENGSAKSHKGHFTLKR